MSELKEKRAAARKMALEIRDLEDQERVQKLWPMWKEREGTCWKFRNSYSCPENEGDYWWVYRKYYNIKPDGRLDYISIQIDKDGRLEIKEECGMAFLYAFSHDDRWVLCAPQEWSGIVMKAKAMIAGVEAM